jgi:integrase
MSKPKKPLNPMRGIFLRGKTYWLASPMVNGQRPPHVTLETSDAIEAQKRAEEIRAHPLLNACLTFPDEVQAFVAYKRKMREWTPSTAKKVNMLTAFGRELSPGKTTARITTVDLQKYHDELLGRGLSDTTVHGYMMIFRSFFNWAVDVRKIMRRNPVDDVRVVKTEGKARADFATYELRDKLIREAPNDDLRFILYCGFHAGMRKLEIIEARAFWFDLDAKMIHMRKTATIQFKDRDERSIPMTEEFAAFLRVYGVHQPFMLKPDVKHGRSLYRYDFRRPLERYMAAQGVPWLTTHILRHTFASLLASSGVSILKIATWLGDDVATVQKHYAKLLPGDKDIEMAFGARRSNGVKQGEEAHAVAASP